MIIHATSYLQVEFIEGGINITATKTGQRLIKWWRTYDKNRHWRSWRYSSTLEKLFGTGWFIGVGNDNGLLFSGEIFQRQPDFDGSKNYYYDNDYALRNLLDVLAEGKTVLLPEFNVD